MADSLKSLYWEERKIADNLIKIIELRLNVLVYSYKKSHDICMFALISKFFMIALAVLTLGIYFYRGEIRSYETIITLAIIGIIVIIRGFFAKKTMRRCFGEIWWYADEIKPTGFKVVVTHTIYDVLSIRPADSQEPELDFTQINWRSFIDHLH